MQGIEKAENQICDADFLLQNTQTLWSEPNFKGLVKHFANTLLCNFDIEEFCMFTAVESDKKISLSKNKTRFPQNGPSEEALALLKKRILDFAPSLHVLSDGITVLDIGGTTYSLALTERPNKAPCILVWKNNSNSDAGNQKIETKYIEVLLRQLQHECHWHRRLHSTQALLYKDDLTGLFNYRYLDSAIDDELRRAQRFGSSFSLLFIDLDDFKQINDNHGHLSGSSVLRQVSTVLSDAVREIDIPIRYGGDEFVIVLLGASTSKALLVAKRIRKQVQQTAFQLEDGDQTQITVSIGISSYPEHSQKKADLLRIADESMYRSKNAGKNRVTILGTHRGFENKHVLRIIDRERV